MNRLPDNMEIHLHYVSANKEEPWRADLYATWKDGPRLRGCHEHGADPNEAVERLLTSYYGSQ